MRRGEIRWYRFSSPDKKRPVLILTRDVGIDVLGEVTVASVTSRIRGIPSEVPLSRTDGMLRDCVVNLDHINTVSKGALGAVLATLPDHRMAEIKNALLYALGF